MKSFTGKKTVNTYVDINNPAYSFFCDSPNRKTNIFSKIDNFFKIILNRFIKRKTFSRFFFTFKLNGGIIIFNLIQFDKVYYE